MPPSTARVLIVEDDAETAALLAETLTHADYTIRTAASGGEAVAALATFDPHLLLLDLGLLDVDGLLLTEVLHKTTSAGLVVLSRRTAQVDRVLSLKLGADDFIANPFETDNLLARIAAVLRRTHGERATVKELSLTCGELEIDVRRHVVMVSGRPVHLTPIEFRIMHLLIGAANLASISEIVTAIWGQPIDRGLVKLVYVNIARIRAKLGTDVPILTVRGRGFRLASRL